MATANKTKPAIVEGAEGGGNQQGKQKFAFKRTKLVTVPVLKLVPGVPVYVKAESAMAVSKQTAQKKGSTVMEPATVMHVSNLESMAEALLIMGTALKGIMNDTYPDDAYVGKCFEIVSFGQMGDKKYNTYTVTEIEVEAD